MFRSTLEGSHSTELLEDKFYRIHKDHEDVQIFLCSSYGNAYLLWRIIMYCYTQEVNPLIVEIHITKTLYMSDYLNNTPK